MALSDPEADGENDKGRPESMINCAVDVMCSACKTSYHPKRELATYERHGYNTVMTQNMKENPTKWRTTQCVLVDSRRGYAVDFNVYVGKARTPQCSWAGL